MEKIIPDPARKDSIAILLNNRREELRKNIPDSHHSQDIDKIIETEIMRYKEELLYATDDKIYWLALRIVINTY